MYIQSRFLQTGLLLAATLSMPSLAMAQTPQVTSLISVSSGDVQGNGGSVAMSMSADARYVAFVSGANNLVFGDSNSTKDIFVRDRLSGTTTLVSVSSAGVQGDKGCGYPVISADGRFVVFNSGATNLIAGDTNGVKDIFVHDRQAGTTECVSKDSSGVLGNGPSLFASISADGRYVAYRSSASNLVSGDTNGVNDIFVHDRTTGVTERVSKDSSGLQGDGHSWVVSISTDGTYVTFSSAASNLDAADTNAVNDIFVHDRGTGLTELVSLGASSTVGSGHSSWPSISADGRFVAFLSEADDLLPGDTNAAADVFVRDRLTGTTELASRDSYGVFGNGDCNNPKISTDGRYVAFTSFADSLVPGDTNLANDVFVHDRQTGFMERVSTDSNGTEAGLGGELPSISEDGRYVAFNSESTNLVTGDTNGNRDIFIHDRMTGGPELTLTNVVAGQVANLSITGATPGGFVVAGVSFTGQGPMPSPWGPVELAGPITLFTFPMDAAGQISLPIGIPVALVGLPLWVQGIDVTMNYPTSVWGGLIQ